jgi:Rrf2 family transcriptional regulator, nitric oxide-sensitive transcriptional repressor
MISQTAEYALRAMLYLAEWSGSSQTIQQIAAATQVPAGYLSKVMQGLARHGLVSSQRGIGGGFTLAQAPAQVSVYAIVQAVDPIVRITHCPLNLPQHAQQLCPLHRRLDDAARLVEQSFRDSTLADLLEGHSFGARVLPMAG